MRVEELQYELPEELIAQQPLEERDQSRLMVVDPDAVKHQAMLDLPGLLSPSLFVFNDTRVIPARLAGRKASGGAVEIVLVERLENANPDEGEEWLVLAKPRKRLPPGTLVKVGEELSMRVLAVESDGLLRVVLFGPRSISSLIETVGEMPLPPYIRRRARRSDRDRYQTIFAREAGAVAAPTAGLHFSPELLRALEGAGHQVATLTLHVGPGTFAPVRTHDLREHSMHSERYRISESTAAAINEVKNNNGAVVAVGTTVVRALESSIKDDRVQPGMRRTSLLIAPPFQFQVVDHLVTNFHLPGSTLLALVMALGGIEPIRRAYAEAVVERYRFFSYGDAMLIRKPRST